jgi:hypothetical protein
LRRSATLGSRIRSAIQQRNKQRNSPHEFPSPNLSRSTESSRNSTLCHQATLRRRPGKTVRMRQTIVESSLFGDWHESFIHGDAGGESRGPRPDSKRGRQRPREAAPRGGARGDGRSIRPTMRRIREEPRIMTLHDIRGDVVGSV